MDPLFSIIIPVYNAERTIERCLNSIISQDYDSYEIIAVNDGSTDNSLSLIKRFAQDHKEIVIIDKPNAGVSSARNRGISVARGKYITFVDSDDYVVPDYFSRLEQFPDADFVVYSFFTIQDDVHITRRALHSIEDQSTTPILKQLISTRNNAPASKRFKREIIDQHRISFLEGLQVGEDFLFCLEYALHSDTASVCEDEVYYYCIDTTANGSLTRRFRPDFLEQALVIYDHAFSLVNESSVSDSDKRALLCEIDYNYYRTAYVCASIYLNNYSLHYKDARASLRSIAESFIAHSCQVNEEKNLIHFVMKFIITHKVIPVMYLVARAAIK